MNVIGAEAERQRVPMAMWLRILETEYLNDYLPSGGSAVKVVSGSPDALATVAERLAVSAIRQGFHFAFLDPARLSGDGKRPDLHRIDKFFFAATGDMDWKEWAAAQARQYLSSRGVEIGPNRALNDLDGIASDNDRDPADLLRQYQSELVTPQIKDFSMALEFRTAVTALGRAQLSQDSSSEILEEVLLGWLRGKSLPGGAAALKKVHIYEKIALGNARTMLTSFCQWLPRVSKSGLVVCLDFRPYEYKRLTKAQRQRERLARYEDAVARGVSAEELQAIADAADDEPQVAYTDAAYMQMLAQIRRFIDEIDGIERFLLVILTTPDYYDEFSRRNYNDYDALQTRIGLEVRDARRPNPTAALVHLSAGGDAP